MSYQTIDPSSGKLIQRFNELDRATISAKLQEAHEAFMVWKNWSYDERAVIFRRIAEDLTKKGSDYAKIMQREMGKPLPEGEAEIKKCALVCQYYADNAAIFLAPKEQITESLRSYVRYDPLGIIFAIMPWNFPFWQVFRVAAPSLMAGNVIVLKHAANTPQCALAIEKIFVAAGCPKGALISLFIPHEDIESIIADRRINGVTFTGGNAAGARVAESAGRHIKPCVMELGGSDPFIVFEDSDCTRAAEVGAASRLLNSGQSCINAKRFLINTNILEVFKNNFINAMRSHHIGPMATHTQRERVHELVVDALNKGAQALCGAAIPDGPGFFYPPTVLANLNDSMRMWHEEVFGPVASLIPFTTDDEALTLANTTKFGLAAAVWTRDAKRIDRFCRDLECGTVVVNDLVKSDPRLPFGGVKDSGFGRELGEEGLRSFVNIKTIQRQSI